MHNSCNDRVEEIFPEFAKLTYAMIELEKIFPEFAKLTSGNPSQHPQHITLYTTGHKISVQIPILANLVFNLCNTTSQQQKQCLGIVSLRQTLPDH